ncbi:uncharacterized protein LOC126774889 [Nymphalis io]|uniref:uncharacterized protein LOC126774889 n=1 Tax=Inachis io TaxID=171585 RepID=UPI002167CF94|nr:uncharacterized protein LOC126774889 [Nymphalis io]
MNVILGLLGITSIIEGVVLDPALYLAPSPPLTTSKDNDAQKMWSGSMVPRMKERDNSATFLLENSEGTSLEPESMEESETFWPRFRSSSLKGIYVPLSFHLSGTYGGGSGTGVYSSGYIDMPEAYGNLGKAVLAGTNYKSSGGYSGLRIFGSSSRPVWSGWGNGKWGHYGKG